MEENLSKLVDYTIPGDEQSIVVSGSSSRLYTRYEPPMKFLSSNTGYEMALYRLETYFSFPNIDSTNNSIRISIDGGKNWLDLKIPTGCYGIDGINEVLQRLLPDDVKNDGKVKKPYIVLSGNRNTLKCVLEIIKDTKIINFDIKIVLEVCLDSRRGNIKAVQKDMKVKIMLIHYVLILF